MNLPFVKLKNKKIFAIVEARSSSKRLKGKILKKLDKKNKLIDYVISNLLKSKYFTHENIIIATTLNKNDDKFCNYLKTYHSKIQIFRGPETNVFKRIFLCSNKFKTNFNLRYTADNPFVDPIMIDKFIDYYFNNKLDYLSSRTMDHTDLWDLSSQYPQGLSIEIYKKKMMDKVYSKVNAKNMDYPTWFFYTGKFKFKIDGFPLLRQYGKYENIKYTRVTIDTNKDISFIKKLIKNFKLKPGMNNFLKISKIIKKKKLTLININQKIKLAHQVIYKR